MSNDLADQSVVRSGADSPLAPAGLEHAVVALCTAVLPLWGRHLATSRNQSEAAVAEMLSSFESIGPHLDMATRQSRQITAALSQSGDGVTQLVSACAKEFEPVMAGLSAPAAAAVGRVLASIERAVTALEQVAKPFEHETQMVTALVERMYVGLQYQDRVSQMMTLLLEDMERLQVALVAPGAGACDFDRDAWLARLESRYAMAEQRQDHGRVGDAGADSAGPQETTFF